MKRKFLAIAAVAITGIAALISSVACSNEEKSLTTSSENLAMIERAKEFGQMHNVRVAEALADLKATPSRAGGRSMVDVRAQVSNFLAAKAKSSRGDGLPPMPGGGGFGSGDDSTFIDGGKSIRDQMNADERFIVDRGLNAFDKGLLHMEIDNLLLETAASDLPDLHKEAVMCFLTTLQSSEIYWHDNGEDWVAFLRANLLPEDLEIFQLNDAKISWRNVIKADAYWGFLGILSSIGNISVGATYAAAGSIYQAINELNPVAPANPTTNGNVN